MLAMFFWAFVVGGLICVVGQLLFDVAKVNTWHTLSLWLLLGQYWMDLDFMSH